MAFYPTWQADPSQGWQNQFIQQIPQNTPGITSLNSLDFQTQSYGYPSNGYVQTGLGFDPNYGRSPYGAPVQRYDFQSQQLSSAPINQVGLQGVGFAPSSVAYAGQVSTGPAASSVSLQQQQHLGSDLNKTMSGNDTPGYPRVSSVPPRSLNCNGYSGDYSGNSTQQQQQTSSNASTGTSASTTSSTNSSTIASVNGGHQTIAHNTAATQPAASPMQAANNQTVPQSPTRSVMQQPPQTQTMTQQARHVSQSPNQVAQSPNANMTVPQASQQQYGGGTTIPASPHHGVGSGLQTQSQNNIASPPQHPQPMQQDWNWNSQTQAVTDPYQQSSTGPGGERVNLNTRIKSMIMRKNDPKDPLSSTAPPDIHGMPGAPPPPMGVSGANGNQQQQQTGHFLSYSHHLRGDSAMNSNGSNGSNGPPSQQPAATQQNQSAVQAPMNAGLSGGPNLAPEPIGGGGDHIWKPHHTNSFKKPVASGFPAAEHHHQQPLAQAPPQHTTTAHADPPKKVSRRSRSNRSASSASASSASNSSANADNAEIDKNSNDPGGGHHLTHLTNIKIEKGVPYPPPPSSHYPPQHPDYHHAPYIKTEPGLIPGQHNKMEGYERNYQNFVQYADFCQTEVQGQPGSGGPQQPPPPHHQNQQDYTAAGYHPNSSYYGSSTTFQQSYQQNFVPNYQHSSSAFGNTHGMHSHTTPLSSGHSKSMNGPLSKHHPSNLHHHSSHMMDIDRKPETSSIIPLPTNYEKDIPAHAYPIPPHRYPLGHGPTTHPHLSSGLLEPKVEDMGGAYGPGGSGYVFHGEGGPAAIKNSTGFSCCRQGGTRAPTAEHLKDGSCIGMQTKDEILDEEEAQNANQNGAKPKKKVIKQEEPTEVAVKHEKINPLFDTSDRLEKGNKTEVPECDCFQSDKSPPEPGTYYTHLGKCVNIYEGYR